MTNKPFFDGLTLPKEPFKGPMPNVTLKLTVDAMRAQIAHYFTGYEDAIKGAIEAEVTRYLGSEEFAKDLAQEVRREVMVQARNAVLRQTSQIHERVSARVRDVLTDDLGPYAASRLGLRREE